VYPELSSLALLYIVLPCVVAVVPRLRGRCCTVLIARFDVNANKRRLLLLLSCPTQIHRTACTRRKLVLML